MKFGGGDIEFSRVGALVVLTAYNVKASLHGSWGTCKLCDVPVGYRPRIQVRQKAVVSDTDNDYSCGFWVSNKNELLIANFGGTGVNGSFTFSCTAAWTTNDRYPA